jgi:hypothetical protein
MDLDAEHEQLPDATDAVFSSLSHGAANVPAADKMDAAVAAKKIQDQANATAKRRFDQENGWNQQFPGFRFYIGEDNAGRIECTLCEVRIFFFPAVRILYLCYRHWPPVAGAVNAAILYIRDWDSVIFYHCISCVSHFMAFTNTPFHVRIIATEIKNTPPMFDNSHPSSRQRMLACWVGVAQLLSNSTQ